MQEKLSATSGKWTFSMFLNVLFMVSIMLYDLYLRPKRPWIWATIIIIAAAEVNADVTGMEMKSTKKPGHIYISVN